MRKSISEYDKDEMPECLQVNPGDAIRWNGTKHWNHVVQISENYLLTRRHSKWGWRYYLVARRKSLATIDLFETTYLQYQALSNDGAWGYNFTDNDFLQILEEKKPFNKWLLPSCFHIYFLEVKKYDK